MIDASADGIAVLDHDGGRTVLSSNWLAGASSKHTTVELRGGRVRLEHGRLGDLLGDHTAQAGTQPAGRSLAAGHVDHHQGARDRHDRESQQGWLVVEEEADAATVVHRGPVSGSPATAPSLRGPLGRI